MEKRISREFLEAALDCLSFHMAILDRTGTIIRVNRAWKIFADQNGLNWGDYGVGRNYLSVFNIPEDLASDGMDQALVGIRSVMEGTRDYYFQEYPCHSPDEQRWFNMRIIGFRVEDSSFSVVAHEVITERKIAEQQRDQLIKQLLAALEQVKQLSGLLPICANCKKIRDDDGNWYEMETFIRKHSEANFSHSICPVCAEKLYKDYLD